MPNLLYANRCNLVSPIATAINSILHRQRPLSVGGLPADLDIDTSQYPSVIAGSINVRVKECTYYTQGPPELEYGVRGLICIGLAILDSCADVTLTENEGVRLHEIRSPIPISDLDVVKFESVLSERIFQHQALPNEFLKRILDTSDAKATEMVASLAKSRRLRYRFSWATRCVGAAAVIATMTGPLIRLPVAVVVIQVGLETCIYPLWKNRNNVDVKRICLLKVVADYIGDFLARVQALKGYAEEGKMACGALRAANSPQVDSPDRDVLTARVLDSIKNHSDKLKECAQYINHAVESVFNDAISYET